MSARQKPFIDIISLYLRFLVNFLLLVVNFFNNIHTILGQYFLGNLPPCNNRTLRVSEGV